MASETIRYSAAGGVVMNGEHVLVLRRPSRHEIRLPKGHIEAGEEPDVAALREVEEESGYGGLQISADLGTQTTEFNNPGKGHIIREERFFLVQAADGNGPQPGPHEDQYEPEWVSWDEAERILTYSVEREWVRRARKAREALQDHR